MAPTKALASEEEEGSASLLQHQPPETTDSRANAGGISEERPGGQASAQPPTAPKIAAVDRLGAEVTAIVTPVSICMLLVVVLVRFLELEHDDDSNAQTAPSVADLYYQEHAGVRKILPVNF